VSYLNESGGDSKGTAPHGSNGGKGKEGAKVRAGQGDGALCDRPVSDHSPRIIAIFSLNAVLPIVQVEPGSAAWRAGVDITDCTRNEI
jgi:hypothetical protein